MKMAQAIPPAFHYRLMPPGEMLAAFSSLRWSISAPGLDTFLDVVLRQAFTGSAGWSYELFRQKRAQT
jgi:hypothetical protein